MKKDLSTLVFLLMVFIGFSQTLRNDKYELYLINFQENEVNIAKGMYMTDNKQYYYEGTIEVTFMNNGKTSNFNFFFSAWDDKYKEFVIKDANFNILKPKIFFNNKEIAYVIVNEKEKETKLKDNSSLENAILSSMVVWLDNR